MEQVQFSPFTELLTEGFDNDQIWEEIASQNEPFLDYAKTTLKQLNKKPVKQYSEEDESMSESAAEQDPMEITDQEDLSEEEEEQDLELEESEEEEGEEEEGEEDDEEEDDVVQEAAEEEIEDAP